MAEKKRELSPGKGVLCWQRGAKKTREAPFLYVSNVALLFFSPAGVNRLFNQIEASFSRCCSTLRDPSTRRRNLKELWRGPSLEED